MSPKKCVVLDTDTFNEIDDQFALAYLLQCGEVLQTEAIFAAPFFNGKSSGPQDGRDKSAAEIHRLLSLMGREEMSDRVFLGADRFLENGRAAENEAAHRLIELARKHSPADPLYVIGIAAATDLASALLLAPEIAPALTVVWLGGNAYHWPTASEFNLREDPQAVRVLFDSGVRLVHLPCMGVVSAMTTCAPELRAALEHKNPLCDDLLAAVLADSQARFHRLWWSRAIWDVAAIACLADPSLVLTREEPRPLLTEDLHWQQVPGRPNLTYVYHIQRDGVYRDLFTRLSRV